MFYQQAYIPTPIAHPPHLTSLHYNFLILKTLSLALEKSVTKYGQNLDTQNLLSKEAETPLTLQALEKASNQCPPPSITSESEVKKAGNICQTSSEKTISCTSINIKPSKAPVKEIRQILALIEQAKVPVFGLSQIQRQAKMESLLERRVDSWKVERERKKSNRITYNWY